MAKKSNKGKEVKEVVTEVKNPVIPPKPKEFDQQAAEELAKEYLPKDISDSEKSKYNIMYVTSDRNVFFKENQGSARKHAKKLNLELFRVKF